MRLKISLASNNRNYLIPYNYNHILSAIIYRKIADLDLAAKLHFSNDFKFFTFSQIYVPNWKRTRKGIISRDGKLEFFISSPNEDLIKSLVEGHLENSVVNFKRDELLVEQIELLKKPFFKENMEMRTMSPVMARIKREVDGKLKIWDLGPGDERFYESIQKNLINKYTAFYGDYDGERWVKIRPDMNSTRRRRIEIKGNYHRCFMMNFEIEADSRLIEFAYDCGLGEKNSMGFGMVELNNGGQR
ncbi:MAG: CRISPR-associated endoribonuclease Cas6 [Methanobacteriaceae archaeon]|nr:CRISPR-associated endoribonuclease Cas6 [Methanobacteriaceae archaeon]